MIMYDEINVSKICLDNYEDLDTL